VIHATNAYASYLLPHFRGPEGIVPTRGQVIALRADATLQELTRSGWVGNEALEYWFPRPVSNPAVDKPLVILGGGREVMPNFEFYVEDDSVVNGDVGRALRDFLPSVFRGLFKKGREPEMEWVSSHLLYTVESRYVCCRLESWDSRDLGILSYVFLSIFPFTAGSIRHAGGSCTESQGSIHIGRLQWTWHASSICMV